MAYLGIVEAMMARLQGKPKTYVPPLPERPDPQVAGWANVNGVVVRSEKLTSVKVEMPIFYLDTSGIDMQQHWPCLTFDIKSYTPRFDEGATYQAPGYGDEFYEDIGVTKAILYCDGEPMTGEVMKKKRPVAHPYDTIIEIQAHTDDPTVSAMLVRHVYRTLDERSFIRVPMRDGSYCSWDMLFRDFQDLDYRRAVRSGSPGIERQFSKAWTYLIEGFFDDTDLTTLENVVRTRKLNMSKLGG